MTHRPTLTLLAALPAVLFVPAVVGSAGGSAGGPAAEPNRAVAAAAVLQGEGELERLVATEVGRAPERDASELLARAAELRDAERLGTAEELDRALDAWLKRRSELAPEALLFVAAARLLGDDPDAQALAEALLPLADDGDAERAAIAAQLLGNPGFKDLPQRVRQDLVDDLLAGAADAGRPPAFRLRAARSAFLIGDGSARLTARKRMLEFLESDDAALRAQGALALASTGAPIEGRLRTELTRMARVPDGQGREAEAYLKQEDLKEFYERKVRDLRTEYDGNDGVPPELEEFVAVMRMVEDRHLEGDKIDQIELVNAALDGMLRYMDAHSSYLSSDEYSRFFQDLEANYGGIGAYVNTDADTGLFTIVQPIYSGPAYRAGLKTDDKVVRIDDWPTLNQDREEIIKRLKGKPGTDVKLYIWRRGMDPELIERPTDDMIVSVRRELVEIPAGSWQLLPGGIGMIELTSFSKVAMEELESWIRDMRAHGMRGLIFDMRRNSGGLLTEAREVADLFLEPGQLVVSTEGRDRPTAEPLYAREEPLIPMDMPVVILTSRYTASAAEIVSGALKDHGRARLVGKTTFGKGSVQQLLPVAGAPEDEWEDQNRNGRWDPWEPITADHDGDGQVDYAPRVKLTIARYLLPSGRSIHREIDKEGNLISEGGVEPDRIVDLPTIERWRFDEQRRVLDTKAIQRYVDAQWAQNAELFGRLAVNDGKDTQLYPGFDALMSQLNTMLPRNDVRRLLRDEIRRRVQDQRGAEFPFGDFEEDVQVQVAIEEILNALGERPQDITDFGLVFDYDEIAAATDETTDVALLRTQDREELSRRARALVEVARDHALTQEQLSELLSIIDSIERN